MAQQHQPYESPPPPFPSLLQPPSPITSIDPLAAPVGRLTSPAPSPSPGTGYSPNGSYNNRSTSSSPNSGFGASGSGSSSPDPLAAGRHSRRGERKLIPKSVDARQHALIHGAPTHASDMPDPNRVNGAHPLMMNRRDSSPPPPMVSLLSTLPSSRDPTSSITFGRVFRSRTNGDSFDLDLTENASLVSSAVTTELPIPIGHDNSDSPMLPPSPYSNAPPVAMLPPPIGSASMVSPTSIALTSPVVPPSPLLHNPGGIRFIASPAAVLPTTSSTPSSVPMEPLTDSSHATATTPSAAAATPTPTSGNSSRTSSRPRHGYTSSIAIDYDDDNDNSGAPTAAVRSFAASAVAATPSTYVVTTNTTPVVHIHGGNHINDARDSSLIAFPPSAPSSAPTTPKSTASLVSAFPSLTATHSTSVTGVPTARPSAQALVPSLFAAPVDAGSSNNDPKLLGSSNALTSSASGGVRAEVKEVRWANLGPAPSTPPPTASVKGSTTPASNVSALELVTPKKPSSSTPSKRNVTKPALRHVTPPVVPLPRLNSTAQLICWLMDSRPYQYWSILVSIVALLAADFNWAFLPKDCDSVRFHPFTVPPTDCA
jgi:hypothetical protein